MVFNLDFGILSDVVRFIRFGVFPSRHGRDSFVFKRQFLTRSEDSEHRNAYQHPVSLFLLEFPPAVKMFHKRE